MAAKKIRNFLISYSGRVGSTAFIDSLKLLPNFKVPIFEELDAWYVEQHNIEDTTVENIAQCVDETYALHETKGVSVGFKWRIWGDAKDVARTLLKHDVVVFNMVRADSFEFMSSLYLTDIVHREFNAPQFRLKDAASDEERRDILFRYRMQTQTVDLSRFRALFEEGLNRERERVGVLTQLHAAGVEIVTIFYEDFAYKRFRFLDAVLRRLGHPGIEFVPNLELRKVGLPYPSELFENRADVLAAGWVRDAVREWDRVVAPKALETLPV